MNVRAVLLLSHVEITAVYLWPVAWYRKAQLWVVLMWVLLCMGFGSFVWLQPWITLFRHLGRGNHDSLIKISTKRYLQWFEGFNPIFISHLYQLVPYYVMIVFHKTIWSNTIWNNLNTKSCKRNNHLILYKDCFRILMINGFASSKKWLKPPLNDWAIRFI